MNNETLKRDLCARLFENLIVKDDYGMIGTLTSISTNESYECVSVVYNGKMDMLHIEEIKPYLFSTSALTKEIQIASYNNGEPFVPIDELKKILPLNMFLNKFKGDSFEFHTNFKEFVAIDTMDKILDFFHKFHINYRLSPEQFIEVTDEFNPYK